MASMGACDVVVATEMGTDADGDGLFTAIHVQRSLHRAQAGLAIGLFLEDANAPHVEVHLSAQFSSQRHAPPPPLRSRRPRIGLLLPSLAGKHSRRWPRRARPPRCAGAAASGDILDEVYHPDFCMRRFSDFGEKRSGPRRP